jgi:peptide/nickel transport system substrate-binding protein
MIQAGVGFTASELVRLENDPEFDGAAIPEANHLVISLNMHPDNFARIPAVADPNVRRALSYAIDRKSIVEYVFFNKTFADSQYYTTAQSSLRPPDVQYHEYNKELAKQMLDGAGWPVGSDGWRFDMTTLVSYPQFVSVGEVIKQNWKDIGVKLEVRVMEEAAIVDELEGGSKGVESIPGFCGLLQTMGKGPDIATQTYSNLHSSQVGQKNPMCYNSSTMDALIMTAMQTASPPEARQQAYWNISRQFDKDLPAIVIATRARLWAYTADIGGLPESINYPALYFYNLEKMWFKSAAETDQPATGEPPYLWYAVIAAVIITVPLGAYAVVRRNKSKLK